MKNYYCISDTHFGHLNIIEFSKRPFESPEKMNETIIQNWNKTVKDNDRVYLLGDVATNKKYIPLLGQLKGKIILIMGNHDIYPSKLYLSYVEDIRGYVYKEKIIMSHIPIFKGKYERYIHNIHGHLHENILDDPYYTNVCVEQTDYTPINFDEIYEKVTKQILNQ